MSKMRDKSDSRERRRPRHSKPPFVGIGGRIEARVEEAQDPWIVLREGFTRLREEEGSGFTFLRIALYEERRALRQLRSFGIEGQNVYNCEVIEGARQAQTDEELSERNYAYGRLMAWQPTAKTGLVFLVGEWVLAQVAAKFRGYAVSDMQDWLPGPPELSAKLFDVLSYTLIEAMAESQGHLMEGVPKELEGEQATYLLAGLLRTRIQTNGIVGHPLRKALSALAGENVVDDRERLMAPEERRRWLRKLRTQLHRELPGATRIAWSGAGAAGGVSGLRNRVVNYILKQPETKNEKVWREKGQRFDVTEEWLDTQEYSEDDAVGVNPLEDFVARQRMLQRLAQLEELTSRAKLSPQQREIVDLLKHEEGLLEDNGDIAAEKVAAKLGKPANQISVQWRRAKAKLRRASGG